MKRARKEGSSRKPRVLYVVTSDVTARLLSGQLAALSRAGFEMWIASAPGAELDRCALAEGATSVAIPMQRELAPLADLRTLAKLWLEMRRIRPRVSNVSTPKAGLLGGLAAWLTRVPCRIYTLRGLRWETTRGWKRGVLLAADWLACRAAHRVICVSASVRDRAVAAGMVKRDKTVVFGAGSSNGVDAARFAPLPERLASARALRREIGIPIGVPVIGFIGRLTRDKGLADLLEAHTRLSLRWPELRLILVGNAELGDALPEYVAGRIRDTPHILYAGPTEDVSRFYHLMDVLALPSHREGFPNVVLEAGAAGKPVVAARATGTVDAVVEGVTGLLVPVGDSTALAGALERVLGDPVFAARLGSAARARIVAEFSQERLWEALSEEYRKLLECREARPPDAIAADGRGENPVRRREPPELHDVTKRWLDVVVSAALLLLTAPLMGGIALLVRWRLGPPALFRQWRPGLHEKPFELLKFRTMTNACDAQGKLLPDAERLTRLGRMLRILSADELPQFWNVLRGDLSLVGPRPLLMQYLDRYSHEQARRHDVLPGVTGWAQINGRNTISWKQRFELDVWYVDHWSLSLDVKILWLTLLSVLQCEGIQHDGQQTMPEFLGSPKSSLINSMKGNAGDPVDRLNEAGDLSTRVEGS